MSWKYGHWSRMPMLYGLTAPEIEVLLERGRTNADGVSFADGVSVCTRYVRDVRGLDLRSAHHQVQKFSQALGTAALTMDEALEFATDPANWKESS